MKKLLIKITSIIIVISFILSAAPLFYNTIYAAEDMSFKKIGEDIYTYDKNKEFIVTLSTPIDKNSVNENSVYIRTNENKIVLVNSQVDELDNRKIKIKPPNDGYKKDIRYTIYVKKLRSKKGTLLKENVKQSFMYIPGNNKKNDELFSDEKGKIKSNVVEVNDSDKFINDIKAANLDVDGTEKLKLILPQKSPDEKPEPGKVLVIKPNNEFLNGIAVKAESVKKENGNYVIVGKTPEIQEVFENLEIKDDVNIAEYVKNNENISLIKENGMVKGYELDGNYVNEKLKEHFGDESNTTRVRGRRIRRDINYDKLKPSIKIESPKVHIDINTSKKTVEVFINSSLDFKMSHVIELTKKIDKKVSLGDLKIEIPIKPPFKVNIIIKTYIEFAANGELKVKIEVERKVGFKLGKRFKATDNSFEDINEITNKKNMSFNAGASCTVDAGPVLEIRIEITAFEANILLIKWDGVTIVSTTGKIALKSKFDAKGNIGLNINDDGVKATVDSNIDSSLMLKIYIPVSLIFEFDCIKLMGMDLRAEALKQEFVIYQKKLSSTGSEISRPSTDNISYETLLNMTDDEIREMFKDENVLHPSSNHLVKVKKFEYGIVTELEMPSEKPAILYIPEEIEGVKVRGIALSKDNLESEYKCVNYSCDYIGKYYDPNKSSKYGTIERAVFPDTLRDIDYLGRYEIKHANLPSYLYNIGECAFAGCKLKKINIPNSVRYIGKRAFDYNELESVKIPDNITIIEKNSFGHNNINIIKLSNGLNILSGFSGNKNLKNIRIPNTVKKIGSYAFDSCDIKELIIPNGVEEIGEYAFSNNERLRQITIPNSVEEIGECAFENCDIRELIIPNSVRKIGDHAFSDNRDLISITIPGSVEEIGEYAFYGCDIKELIIPNSVRKVSRSAFWSNKGLRQITIPNSVEEIGEFAFNDCDIRELIIPNSVRKIGNRAFNNNKNLISIRIPGSVEEIGFNAFENCTSLSEVIIENGVKSIKGCAFTDTNVRRVVIPSSVAIDYNAFPRNCEIIRSN